MFKNLKKAFELFTPALMYGGIALTIFSPASVQAAIGISTPSVNSGELIRASDWNKVKLDLETIAAAVGSLQNQTWDSSGADTYYDSGNVGIGINSPTATMHLFATTPAANSVLLQLGTTDDPDRVRIDEDGDMTIDGKFVVRDSDIYESGGDLELSGEDSLYLTLDWNDNDADTQALYFGKNSAGAGVNFVELMRLTETGRLGVGVADPLSDIHVGGSVQIGGDVEACIAAKAGAIRYDTGALERCDGSAWDALATTNVSDNLGSHTATQNLDLDTFRMVGEGGTGGIGIDADGAVGIGTDNPTTNLDIVSDATPSLSVRTTALSGEDAAVIITGAQTTSTTADIASIKLTNKDGSPFEGARISLRNGDATDATAFGDLLFSTNTGAGDSLTEKMRILDDGKVGIGTSGPTSQLHVIKDTPAANEIVLQIGTNSDVNRFSVDEDGDVFNDGNYYVGGGNILASNGSVTVAGEDNLYLATDWNNNDAENRSIIFGKNGVGGGGGFAELARINENGKVGINTIDPKDRFHVIENNTSDRIATFENNATTGSPEGVLVLTGQGAGPAPALAVGTGTEATHTNKFVVTNAGNVGIGTANPVGTRLQVESGVTDMPARFISSDNKAGIEISDDDTTAYISTENTYMSLGANLGVNVGNLNIDSSGNVGIGVVSPGAPLHIASNTPYIYLEDLEDVNGSIGAISSYQTGVMYYDANVNNTASLGAHYFRAEAGTNNIMALLNNGNVGIGTVAPSGTLEVARGTATGGTAVFRGTTNASHFNYDTAENTYIRGGKATSNVILNDLGGNVGVGTGNPTKKLQIHDGDLRLSLSTSGVGDEAKIFMGADLNDYLLMKDQSGATAERFSIVNNDVEALTIRTGKVGIGTTNPAAQLHVVGETRFTGISADGTGKVVCVKSDGDIGTCTDAPNGTGACSCS